MSEGGVVKSGDEKADESHLVADEGHLFDQTLQSWVQKSHDERDIYEYLLAKTATEILNTAAAATAARRDKLAGTLDAADRHSAELLVERGPQEYRIVASMTASEVLGMAGKAHCLENGCNYIKFGEQGDGLVQFLTSSKLGRLPVPEQIRIQQSGGKLELPADATTPKRKCALDLGPAKKRLKTITKESEVQATNAYEPTVEEQVNDEQHVEKAGGLLLKSGIKRRLSRQQVRKNREAELEELRLKLKERKLLEELERSSGRDYKSLPYTDSDLEVIGPFGGGFGPLLSCTSSSSEYGSSSTPSSEDTNSSSVDSSDSAETGNVLNNFFDDEAAEDNEEEEDDEQEEEDGGEEVEDGIEEEEDEEADSAEDGEGEEDSEDEDCNI